MSSEDVAKYVQETQRKKTAPRCSKKKIKTSRPRKSYVQEMSTSESETEDDLVFDDSTDTPSEDDSDDDLLFEEPSTSNSKPKNRNMDIRPQIEINFAIDEFVIVNYEGTPFPGVVTGINATNHNR